VDDYFFCHAGIRPGVPLDRQIEDDLIWIRADFLEAPDRHPKIIVHGHSPTDDVTHYGNRINIDTGAAYGKALSTVAIEGEEVFLLDASGRLPILREG